MSSTPEPHATSAAAPHAPSNRRLLATVARVVVYVVLRARAKWGDGTCRQGEQSPRGTIVWSDPAWRILRGGAWFCNVGSVLPQCQKGSSWPLSRGVVAARVYA